MPKAHFQDNYKVYVALGSNLGNRENHLKSAITTLQSHEKITNVKVSHFYDNPAISSEPQPNYLNGVCCFNTTLSLKELFYLLQDLERQHGVRKKGTGEARHLDLDLLFFDQISYSDAELTVPHPRWKERLFVLIPLADLTSEIVVEGQVFNIQKMIEKGQRT